MRSLLLPIFLLVFSSISAQTELEPYQTVPRYPGGEAALKAYLRDSFQTPQVKKRVKGKVVASFVIGKEGRVEEATILMPLHPAVDAEFLRLLRAMPTWQPGRSNGNPVKVRYTLPMTVDIPGNKSASNYDWHLSLGSGAWSGLLADRLERPPLWLGMGFSLPLKKWRVGAQFDLTQARTTRYLPLDGYLITKDENMAIFCFSLEAQRPVTLHRRLVVSPLAGVGVSGANRFPANQNLSTPWGGQLEIGTQLDWLFVVKPTLRHALRLRAVAIPMWWTDGFGRGTGWMLSLGFSIQGR